VNAAEHAALCRLVGVLLVTDGHLTDPEFDYFTALLDRFGLSGAARAEVTDAITIDADLSADLKLLASSEARQEVLDELERAATLDGEVSPPVADLLARLREALA